jgi:hypothetical protein
VTAWFAARPSQPCRAAARLNAVCRSFSASSPSSPSCHLRHCRHPWPSSDRRRISSSPSFPASSPSLELSPSSAASRCGPPRSLGTSETGPPSNSGNAPARLPVSPRLTSFSASHAWPIDRGLLDLHPAVTSAVGLVNPAPRADAVGPALGRSNLQPPAR